jgi:hypothetical protein
VKPTDFAKIVNDRMNALGMTRRELHRRVVATGHKCGCVSIYNFTNGTTAIRSDTLAAIFGVLDISVNYPPTVRNSG